MNGKYVNYDYAVDVAFDLQNDIIIMEPSDQKSHFNFEREENSAGMHYLRYYGLIRSSWGWHKNTGEGSVHCSSLGCHQNWNYARESVIYSKRMDRYYYRVQSISLINSDEGYSTVRFAETGPSDSNYYNLLLRFIIVSTFINPIK